MLDSDRTLSADWPLFQALLDVVLFTSKQLICVYSENTCLTFVFFTEHAWSNLLCPCDQFQQIQIRAELTRLSGVQFGL